VAVANSTIVAACARTAVKKVPVAGPGGPKAAGDQECEEHRERIIPKITVIIRGVRPHWAM